MSAEFTEMESGKRDDREQLQEAICQCHEHGATLVTTKLDRLARSVFFVSRLMRSCLDFIALDVPSVNKLTIHVLFAVAESEAALISERTRAGLAVARAKGFDWAGRSR